MGKIVRKLKNYIKSFISKLGFKTNRHIIVFESDDWGSVRNSTYENLEKLKSLYPDIKFDHYQSLDVLERNNDVEDLYNLLIRHKDSKENFAKFTLNYIMANPDFEKIKNNNLTEIYYEDFFKTYNNTNKSKEVLNVVKKGISSGVFKPQLHSREHFNSKFLLDDLQTKQFVRDAFDLNIIGVLNETYCALDTLNNFDNSELLTTACKNFEKAFGYKSKTFVAPCYVWDLNDEIILSQLGVRGIQTKMAQNRPFGRDCYKRVFHKFGARNKKSGLIYTIRNCFFEPSRDVYNLKTDDEILTNVLHEIELAFKSKKPAVICSHRVNYVSGMSQENKIHNLVLLDKLLSTLEERYVDLEYKSSDELLDMLVEK